MIRKRKSGRSRENVLEAEQDEKMGKWEMDRVDFLSSYHQDKEHKKE